MAGLTPELREEHEQLLVVLDLAKRSDLSSPEARELLGSARSMVLAHLRKEDIELYPVLKTAALKDASLKGTLELFAADMADISHVAISFFKKCEQPRAGRDWAHDFGLVVSRLQSRIRREEEFLFPLYDKIMAKKAA